MGRYDKIRYGNGSKGVQPSQMKVGNGSTGVDYGTNDSTNTKSLYAYNGSGGQRFTKNKKVTNTSTLNYKYLRSPINGAGTTGLNNAYHTGGAYRFARYFSGYVCVSSGTTDNCGIWGNWYNGAWNTGGSYDDMRHMYSTGHFCLRSRYNGGTTYSAYSCRSMTRGDGHGIKFASLYCYNRSTAYNGRSIMQIDSGGEYWMKTGESGGGSAQDYAGLYVQWNCYPRIGGSATYYKGPITFKGVNSNGTIVTTTIDIDGATVGSKISTSSVTTGKSDYTVSGNYTNTSTTTGE